MTEPQKKSKLRAEVRPLTKLQVSLDRGTIPYYLPCTQRTIDPNTTQTTIFEPKRTVVSMKEGKLTTSVDRYGKRYRTRFSTEVGQEGKPWHSGFILSEDDPARHPLLARGYGTDRGRFARLMDTPEIESTIEDRIGINVNAPWNLQKPELPPHLKGDKKAQARLEGQWALQQYVWWTWNLKGRADHVGRSFLRPIFNNCYVGGFYVGEYVTEERRLRLGDSSTRNYVVMRPPRYRATRSIYEWIFQNNQIKGAFCDYSYVVDSAGTVSSSHMKVLPYDKLCHVVARPMGLTDAEGRSHLRSLETRAAMHQNALEKEALAVDTVALGTVVVNLSSDTEEGDADALETQFKGMDAGHLSYVFVAENDKVTWISPLSTMPNMTSMIHGHRDAIFMGMGNEGRVIGTGTTGSFGARKQGSQDGARQDAHTAEEYGAYGIEQSMRFIVIMNDPDAVKDGHVFVAKAVPGARERKASKELFEDLKVAQEMQWVSPEESREIARKSLGI